MIFLLATVMLATAALLVLLDGRSKRVSHDAGSIVGKRASSQSASSPSEDQRVQTSVQADEVQEERGAETQDQFDLGKVSEPLEQGEAVSRPTDVGAASDEPEEAVTVDDISVSTPPSTSRGRFSWKTTFLSASNSTAQRKLRRAWAEKVGGTFRKTDGSLAQQWKFLAEKAQSQAREIVSGSTQGNEFHLFSLDSRDFLALRRPAASPVVVDARRSWEGEGSQPEELLTVGDAGGFEIRASEAQAAIRMMDVRSNGVLERLPSAVVRIWVEGEWVLAEASRSTDPEDWDRVLSLLADFAEASLVLPPRRGASSHYDPSECDPSRELPEGSRDEEWIEGPEDIVPVVPRAEAPIALPSRSVPAVHGRVGEAPALGGDAVTPIANGERPDPNEYQGTRVLRPREHSTIFDDLARELGADPLASVKPATQTDSGNAASGLDSVADEDPVELDQTSFPQQGGPLLPPESDSEGRF